MITNFQQLANFIWSVADLLRGPYRPPQYERVMLPLTVLRRFDAVLAPSKQAVLSKYAELDARNKRLREEKREPINVDPVLNNLAKDENGTPLGFHNHSQLDFQKLKGDPDNIGRHLADYITGFSENIRKIFERDQLEAIVALPEQMFYNTGISTFIWVVSNRKAAHRKGKIQLIDARERYTPMKRSLGDKRRYLDQAALDAITREHGALEHSKTSRIFDNNDFGYRRITVLRPLRLRFQITEEARERFLNTCPELFDALQALQDELGSGPLLDWNDTWNAVQQVFMNLPDDVEGWTKGARGAAQRKIFRDCFTRVDPEAAPVITKWHKTVHIDDEALFTQPILADLSDEDFNALLGFYSDGKRGYVEYEADPALKDAENIPLKEDIVSYFLREVQPYVADAWIDCETLDEQDGAIGKVGYEINFNRVFFEYMPPRPLAVIDAELAEVEKRIMSLLRDVTE